MLKTYKYRIYPSAEQQELLVNIFGQVRFVYNLGLETKKQAYNGNRVQLSNFDLNNQLPELKKEIEWLKQTPAQSLQQSLKNLETAFKNFYKGSKFPKFKSKYSKQSFSLPQGVSLNNNQIFIPKLKFVDIDLHRTFKGIIKTVTLVKSTTGKYYVNILVENNKPLPNKKPIMKETSVGIDLGIKDIAITSDSIKFNNQRFLESKKILLRKEQRSLSRKTIKSNHWVKQKQVVGLLHEKVRNQRNDNLHKISKFIVDNYDTIMIEDLSVSNMVKNRRLSKAISDVGWRNLRSMLEYKSDWYGKNLITVDKWFPSSKKCSNCGNVKPELKLSERTYICSKCGFELDRDVNAAINIKNWVRNNPGVTERKAVA